MPKTTALETANALPGATMVILRDMAAALIKRGALFRSDFKSSIDELVAHGEGTREWHQAELVHIIINEAVKIAEGEVIPVGSAKPEPS